jgi:hypothetical protein
MSVCSVVGMTVVSTHPLTVYAILYIYTLYCKIVYSTSYLFLHVVSEGLLTLSKEMIIIECLLYDLLDVIPLDVILFLKP